MFNAINLYFENTTDVLTYALAFLDNYRVILFTFNGGVKEETFTADDFSLSDCHSNTLLPDDFEA